MSELELINVLSASEKAIGTLMLEVNRLNVEIEALKTKTLTDEEIDEVWVETCSDFKLIENGKTKGIINIYDVSRAILKKASEK
jgi:hypothetical protein